MESVSRSGKSQRATPILPVPTLWPHQLLPRAPWSAPSFPFNVRHLETTYLARNAVWRAVKRLGLDGWEVVMPAYHHGVEVAALLDAGASVRYARVDEHIQLDLNDVEAQITPRTRAVYVIHYAGFPQNVKELRKLCDRRNLLLLEDCALSLFSQDGEHPLGTHGDASFFCFYKSLPLSHGGALLLANREHRRADAFTAPPLRSTTSHVVSSLLVSAELKLGRLGAVLRRSARSLFHRPRAWARRSEIPVGTQLFDPHALAFGMSGIASSLARNANAQEVVRRRRGNWLALHRALGDTGRAAWRELPEGACPLFYGLRVDRKDAALAQLRRAGIYAIDFWRFGHASVEPGRFREVEALRNTLVELPCHQDLAPEDLDRLATAARAAARA